MSHGYDLPLRPPILHILLALSGGARHGLGIADEAEAASGGAVRLGPGTLYRSLDEMRERGLVSPTDPPAGETDPRRKYYRITGDGRALLDLEIARLARVVDLARMTAAEGGA